MVYLELLENIKTLMHLLDTVPELGTYWEYPAPAVRVVIAHDLNSK